MLIINARITDETGTRTGCVRVQDGKIAAVEPLLQPEAGEQVLDAAGQTLLPAFIDLHSHFRTPGFEYKEDIETGSRAAAAGGYTYVVCMANTKPVCSSATIADEVMEKARSFGLCDVQQVISITENFDGKTLSHLDDLPAHLWVISEDGKGVQNNNVMWHAMRKAKEKGLLLMSHAEDMDISGEDYRLAENIETARNLFLAQYTGARLHMCHVSTKEAIADIAEAKHRGVGVTCEVTPHHLFFHGPAPRVNPPIREQADVDALIEAIKQGTVDAIATDHAPHSAEDKAKGSPGFVGLETAFGACYTRLCRENGVPLETLSRLLSANPARILKLNKGRIAPGYDADMVLAQTDTPYTVQAAALHSKSKNTMFDGVQLYGKITLTVKQGTITYQAE